MSEPARAFVPGALVAGKLRVIRALGAGGMGAVYEVEHEITKHRRALKILHPSVAQSPTYVARFLREASAAARIGNPHIAETFDAGRLDTGEPYLLMELLDGETLDGRVKRAGALEVGEVAELVGQACEGIAAAHDAGIVHRDLKPENLFVTSREGAAFVKVLDFGISKFEPQRTGALGVTAEGAVMGTPYYMPPEQVRGDGTIDHRADIYALGIILYECSAGARPYEAETLTQLAILIHEGKARPLRERVPSLPEDFCRIVHRAMATSREDRFATAPDLLQALAPFRGRTEAAERVVVRPSAPAPGTAQSSRPAAMTTTTAMAETVPTPALPAAKASAPRAGSAAAVAAGAVLVMVGAFVVYEAARGPSGGAGPRAAVSAPPAFESEAPPAAVTLAPVVSTTSVGETTSPTASAIAAPSTSPGPHAPIASSRPLVPSGSARSPSPAPSSRANQTGLANENPFRQ